MNKQLICLMLFPVLFTIGCSSEPQKEIQLTRDNFSQLKASKVKEVQIISHRLKEHPTTGMLMPSGYVFPIRDPEKIKTIVKCIRDANQIDENQRQILWSDSPRRIQDANETQRSLRRTRRFICFETSKITFSTRLEWDNDFIYGHWWRSAELMKKFKEWHFFPPIKSAQIRDANEAQGEQK